jgi:hypothetical protein
MSYETLKRRIRKIEMVTGAGAVNVRLHDGTERGFSLSQNDRLKVSIASFDIAWAARNPEARLTSSPRAREIARLIGQAERVTPSSRLWDTIGSVIRQAQELEKRGEAPDEMH